MRSIGGREVGHLGPHSLVGAPSLLYDQPSVATVTTLEPTRTLVAGRAQFQDIKALDAVALRLRAATADRLRDYLDAGAAATCCSGPLGSELRGRAPGRVRRRRWRTKVALARLLGRVEA